MKSKWKQAGMVGAALAVSQQALAEYGFNLQTPASEIAEHVFQLHNLIMLVCLGIFVVVFGAMFYSLFKHRKSVGHKAAHFHENTTVEVVWTVIPFVILMGMAYPAAKVVIDMKDTANPDLTVKITGYQWKWGYDYLNDGISFYSNLSTPRDQIIGTAEKGEHYLLEVDEPMVVPVGKRVRLLITANDVLHSWWVPALGAKQDAIPGFIRDSWFKADKIGTYRGQCVELCGKDHGFMPIVVEVVSEEDYKAWVAKKKGGAEVAAADNSKTFDTAELMERGEKVYQANCAACHQANGMGLPGAFPAISGSKVATGPIDEHITVVLEGRPGTAMAAFGGQLSDADIAAVVTYQRNAWNNKMGDAAQPAEIAVVRGGAAEAAAPPRSEQPRGEHFMSDAAHAHDDHGHHAHPTGIMRWLTTTNHKDIGTLYLWFALIMLFAAGSMALLIRAELFQPGLQLTNPDFFNQLTTMHGLIMIFGVIMPAFSGFANWQVPLMLGAPDMAFPRMNNWAFWVLPVAGLMLMASFLLPGGAVAGGWTMYPPLFIQGGISYDLTILAVHIMGLSSIMGSINIITTILNMRAPGLTLMKMPLFCWTWLITAYLLIATMPVLAGAVTMLLTDRNFGTHFFNAAGGGDPVMFQHIFWFFAHPEVYILILPAFGIVSQVIPTFARKPLFGYASMVYATASIAILSFIVWAHHMFTVGMPAAAQLFFMFSTMLIAVPTGVKVFNWVATMWQGSMTFETPMLFAIAFVCLFTIGGFSGLVLAIAPVDIQLHDTYYVVAHFHYVLVSGALFAIFAGIYYWMPKWTGHMYDETLGKWHFWLSVIGMNIVFFPMHFLGLAGMPRRIPDYALQFTEFNQIATVGAFIFGFSQLIFLAVVLKSIKGGAKAPARVWEGAEGLEWTVPSPAPYHTFETAPVLK